MKSTELDSKFQYAQIKEVYVYKDHKVLLTNEIKVLSICPHIRSIEVIVTEQELLCHFNCTIQLYWIEDYYYNTIQ